MIDRIKSLMSHYNLSAAQFADRIGIQRSALSHVLSGRNRPSLDFVIKVKSEFPEINLDWLTLGNGSMIIGGTSITERDGEGDSLQFPASEREEPVVETTETHSQQSLLKDSGSRPAKELKEIVLFYTDGTFERFMER